MSHPHYDISTPAHQRPNPASRLRLSALTLAILTVGLLFNSPAHAKDGGWDLEPYHIQITIAIDAPGGVADTLTNELPRYLQRRIEASLTPAWVCDVSI